MLWIGKPFEEPFSVGGHGLVCRGENFVRISDLPQKCMYFSPVVTCSQMFSVFH